MTDAERRSKPTRRKAESVASAERTLPHNLDAERSVIGAVLVHNDAYDQIGPHLKPAHFYRDAHRRIWTAIAALRDVGVAVDFLTLTEEMVRRGDLDEVGGRAYISGLTDGVPRSTNARHYMKIIREKAALRELVYAANAILTAAYEATMPAETILAEADRTLLALQHGHGGQLQSLASTTNELFRELEWRHDHRGELRGLNTGFPRINDMTFGLRKGDVIVIGARPSVGKTTLAINMVVNAAKGGAKIAVFSLEMTRQQLDDRILSQLSGINGERIQRGSLAQADWPVLTAAIEARNNLKIWVDDRAGLTAEDIRAGCRRLVADEGGVDGVVVDYIQLTQGSVARRGASRTEELTDTITKLQALAKELAVPVIVVSQLRRVGGRPTIEDLRECGSLEQIAAVIGLLHRKDHKVSGPTEFILAKQRNGPTGTVMLSIDRDTTTFTEWAGDPPAAEEEQAEQTALENRRRRGYAIAAGRRRAAGA
jgi:replicative DNA helicase